MKKTKKIKKTLLLSTLLLVIGNSTFQNNLVSAETQSDPDLTNQTLYPRDNYQRVDFNKYELVYSEDLTYNGERVGQSGFLSPKSIGFRQGSDPDSDYVMYYAFSKEGETKAGLVATDFQNTGGVSMILKGDRRDLPTSRIYARLKDGFMPDANLPKYIFPLDHTRIDFVGEQVILSNGANFNVTAFKSKTDSTKYVDVLIAEWGNYAYDGITSDTAEKDGIIAKTFFTSATIKGNPNIKAGFGKTIVLDEGANGEKIPFINGLESIHLIGLTPVHPYTEKAGFFYKMKAVDVTPPTLDKNATLQAMGIDSHGNFKLGGGLNVALDKITKDNIVATDDVTPLNGVENVQLIKSTRDNYLSGKTEPVLTTTKNIPGLKDLATIKITDSKGREYTIEQLKKFQSDVPVTFSVSITLKDEAGDLLSKVDPEQAKKYIVTEAAQTALSILPPVTLPQNIVNEYDVDSEEERQRIKSELVAEIKRLNPNNTELTKLPDTAFEIDSSGKLTIRYSDTVVDASVNDAVVVNKLRKTDLKTAVDNMNAVKTSENYTGADPAYKQSYDEAIAAATAVLNSRTATQQEIDAALRRVEAAVNALNGTTTNADKASKIADLEEAARLKKEEIANNQQLTTNEKIAKNQEVDTVLNEEKQKVTQATSDQVATVTQEGVDRINGISVSGTARANAIAEIETAANEKIDEINRSTMTESEKTAAINQVNQIKTDKINAINATNDDAEIDTLKQAGKTEIGNVSLESQGKAAALAELQRAKEAKLQEIASSILTDEEKAAATQAVNNKYTTAESNINNATTNDAVTGALNAGKEEIANVPLTSTSKTNALAELNTAKNAKLQEIASSSLTDEEKAAATQAVNNKYTTAESNINNATTNDGVTQALNNGKTEIGNVSLTSQGKAAALAELNTAKEAKLQEIASSSLTDEEKAVATQAVNDKYTTAESNINNATTNDAVTEALNTGKVEITNVPLTSTSKTNALAELQRAKETKLQDITSSSLTDEEKAKARQAVNTAYDTAVNNINNATTNDAVTEALNNGKTEIANVSLESQGKEVTPKDDQTVTTPVVPKAPTVTTTPAGDVVITPPAVDVASIEVTYTPEGQTDPIKVTIPKGPDGTWTLPNGFTTDATGNIVIPGDKVADGTPVIVVAKNGDTASSEPETVVTPKEVTTNDVVPATPKVTTTPAGDVVITPPSSDVTAIEVTYTPEGQTDPIKVTIPKGPDGNWKVPEGFTFNEKGEIVIPGGKAADGTPVTVLTKNGDTPSTNAETVLISSKTDAEKYNPTISEPVNPQDINNLTSDEKQEIEDKIRKENVLPDRTVIVVGNDGTVTVTYPDGSVDTIFPTKTVMYSTHGKSTEHELPEYDLNGDYDGDGFQNDEELKAGSNPNDPKSVPAGETTADRLTPKLPIKTPVQSTSNLTDAEKAKVKERVENANQHLPKGTIITVKDNGEVTITYPDGSIDIISSDNTIIYIDESDYSSANRDSSNGNSNSEQLSDSNKQDKVLANTGSTATTTSLAGLGLLAIASILARRNKKNR